MRYDNAIKKKTKGTAPMVRQILAQTNPGSTAPRMNKEGMDMLKLFKRAELFLEEYYESFSK
ncbi:MAG: hypothetical protein LUD16_00565, partial [Lachnospiraceae bacterium]|nr:hypothetical protein [Lachnospiraceae bacterium]